MRSVWPESWVGRVPSGPLPPKSQQITSLPALLASQRLSEFELHARAILGLPVEVDLETPAASAVIYGQIEATGIAFAGVDEALRIPGTELRLFGKPESFARRRMGVALARAEDIESARQRARDAASRVRPLRSA